MFMLPIVFGCGKDQNGVRLTFIQLRFSPKNFLRSDTLFAHQAGLI